MRRLQFVTGCLNYVLSDPLWFTRFLLGLYQFFFFQWFQYNLAKSSYILCPFLCVSLRGIAQWSVLFPFQLRQLLFNFSFNLIFFLLTYRRNMSNWIHKNKCLLLPTCSFQCKRSWQQLYQFHLWKAISKWTKREACGRPPSVIKWIIQ